MDGVEGEAVARQCESNRPPSFSTTARQAESTQMDANSWERDRLAAPKRSDGGPGRRGSGLATRSEKKDKDRDVFGGTPNTAVETTAPPMDRISEHSRPFASIRGSKRNSLNIPKRLTQVVDFHDISGYFSRFWWRPFAVLLQFSKVQNRLMQVVDFHDSFSYFWHVFSRKPRESSAGRFSSEANDKGRNRYDKRS